MEYFRLKSSLKNLSDFRFGTRTMSPGIGKTEWATGAVELLNGDIAKRGKGKLRRFHLDRGFWKSGFMLT